MAFAFSIIAATLRFPDEALAGALIDAGLAEPTGFRSNV
jgi:hypothetical protein